MHRSSRKPGARPTQGVEAERRVIGMLRAHGIAAEPAGGHYPWDIVAGRHKIQVKAPRYTEIPDARGNKVKAHVASNIRPGATHLIVAAMDSQRRRIERMYIMPASEVPGRTLTITATMAEKLKPWLNRYDIIGGKR